MNFKTSLWVSYLFVIIQFFCLGLIAVTGPLIASGVFFQLLELSAIVPGIWAVWTMRIGHFNIIPDVPIHGKLVEIGPFRYVRHPMYASLLLVTLVLVLNHFSLFRMTIWVVLLIDLLMKLSYEEKLLAQRFPNYPFYRKRTKCLIPFIY
jgi:protein-S-isoprenylcysteine O-methyltransferase Ste14